MKWIDGILDFLEGHGIVDPKVRLEYIRKNDTTVEVKRYNKRTGQQYESVMVTTLSEKAEKLHDKLMRKRLYASS